MQNKGVIKFFAIALAVICLFQLSFTFFTTNIERKAKRYAMNEEVVKSAAELAKGNAFLVEYYQDSLKRIRERYFLDSVSDQVIYNLLIRKYTYKECKNREINLGLDLKGGMNVTMEVSIADIINVMSGHSKDSTFLKALSLAEKKQQASTKDFVTLFGESFIEVDPNAKLAAIFSTVELKDKIKFSSTNDEVLDVIRKESSDAFDRTFNILRTRIDRFGVTQPNIQKLQQSGRILIELPGIKDPDRVRKLLQGTAQLEFWETYEYKDVYSYFDEANKKLKAILSETPQTIDSAQSLIASKDKDIKKADSTKSEKSLIEKVSQDTTQDKLASGQKSFAEFAKENPLFAYLRPAVVQDKQGKFYPKEGPVVGYAAYKDINHINELLAKVSSVFPRNLKLLWSVKAIKGSENVYELIALKVTSRDGEAALGGEAIVDARQDFSQNGGNEISMAMNSEGARTWKRMTADNIGKCIAIVLDNYVYSFPRVQSEIPNGHSSITGDFSLEEAKDLANILKAGKLPAPARIVQEAVVGPSLGKEAINSGLTSFVIAFILVLLYMGLYYNKAGWIANIALCSNIFFLMGVLASLGAVLTLPGIAGIVLTLGMAVDANVIIYERIREELRAGKGLRLAVSDGYKHAYSAIIDGNVTTILTGIVLYIFGSGPIQGFATTLIIGLCTSLFSAIFISRLVFLRLLDHNKTISFDNNVTRNILTHPNINFIGIRKTLYVISLAVITLGIVSLATKGLNYGVDFTGGRTYIVRFDKPVKTTDIRASLYKEFGEAPEVKTFGPDNQVKITTKYLINDNSSKVDSLVDQKLYNGLNSYFTKSISFIDFSASNQTVGILSSEKVGPTIASDIKRSAILAVIFALISIFIYIAIRFRNWQFGAGGIISLFHDSIITISMFSIFSGIMPFTLEVDQAFIAAILTIIGYSINDTVIILDRIREYRTLYPKRDLKTNMNSAMNSTLGRTLNTSGTTLIVLLAIFLFGGEVIKGFTFALLVGIAIGTYSSVFNATPIAYDLLMWKERRRLKKEGLAQNK